MRFVAPETIWITPAGVRHTGPNVPNGSKLVCGGEQTLDPPAFDHIQHNEGSPDPGSNAIVGDWSIDLVADPPVVYQCFGQFDGAEEFTWLLIAEVQED